MSTTTTLEEIYSPVESQVERVPATILEILSTPNELAGDVIEYFFSARGKLLRPALTCLGASIKGLAPEEETRLLKLAASFEIFHAATLIHDDIIDSAYLRRNLPTINVKWGPQVAVLVGDYLHDKAIGTIIENGTPEVIKTFLTTAGTVCDGEIHELQKKSHFALAEEEYLEIIKKKTAVLLACALKCGALIAGATEEEASALERFGTDFGIAFQIVDDCLDYTGNQNEFGKTLGADVTAGVLTLPMIRLLATVDEKQKLDIIQLFQSPDVPGQFQPVLEKIRDHGALEYSVQRARDYSNRARKSLALFGTSAAKQSLDRLVDYVLERNK